MYQGFEVDRGKSLCTVITTVKSSQAPTKVVFDKQGKKLVYDFINKSNEFEIVCINDISKHGCTDLFR